MIITVKKYDPTVDEAPYYKDYEVPFSEHMTLLQALVYIDENHEPLAFDFNCRGRTCGRCSMTLDGVACLACTTPLKDRDYTVEPLGKFPVIRDLVVDKRSAHDALSNLSERMTSQEITWEKILEPVGADIVEKLDALERCARCMVCSTNCPVVNSTPDRYAGPAAMMAIALRHYDPYDEGDRVLQAVKGGLWNCIMCGTCDTNCHCFEIDHLKIYQELRDAAEARGLTGKAASALKMGEL